MGCDGGTIPKRDELVRTKKKPEKVEKKVEREAKWKHCALTQEPLRDPVVSCELGRLYNKEAVLEYLLEKSHAEKAEHISSIKDVHTLKFTENPAYTGEVASKGDGYTDTETSKYICPVTSLEMNGMHRFVFLLGCNCVLSDKALKELKTVKCVKCGSPYTQDDVIVINGSEEDVKDLRQKMEARKMLAKQEKKSRKKKLQTNGVCTNEKPACKQMKLTNGSALPSASSSSSSGTTTSLQKNGVVPKRGIVPSSSQRSDNGTKSADKISNGLIADDPNASKVYKSLFTTSDKAKQQGKAHWITYNPFYN
ncbi:PREDICTED: protein RTF2 homolog [Priapulus caudatus]|uniref:Replication termination factor 2 n=1 Tax=Priapulus caudatus TaxID=37621 RepID=A0ABM1E1N7_PRICU|nr:PREDICTED: protein RTF2 homolog [Priapulus caudatus]